MFFLPPYFNHDAFMHHTIHVLDAPGDNLKSHMFHVIYAIVIIISKLIKCHPKAKRRAPANSH